MSQQLQLIKLIQLVEARSRVPDYLLDTHPYSNSAIWQYYELGDPDSECNYCKQYGSQAFAGSQLRSVFPDHIFDGDDILPRVHITLWGKDTCKCRLIRLDNEKLRPEELVFYTGDKTPHWTPDGYKTK